jgi:hypothetical protein
MELLAQVSYHRLERDPAQILVKMLAHQNFTFEQGTFASSHYDDEEMTEARLDRFVPEYVCDKDFTDLLIATAMRSGG